jgi:hypothetical protein
MELKEQMDLQVEAFMFKWSDDLETKLKNKETTKDIQSIIFRWSKLFQTVETYVSLITFLQVSILMLYL